MQPLHSHSKVSKLDVALQGRSGGGRGREGEGGLGHISHDTVSASDFCDHQNICLPLVRIELFSLRVHESNGRERAGETERREERKERWGRGREGYNS